MQSRIVTDDNLHTLFGFFLVGATLLSFYFLVLTVFFKKTKHLSFITTFQFPLLLALSLELFYE